MEEKIFNFISATFGISFAVTLAIMFLALWLTHYITRKITLINAEHSQIKEEAKAVEERIDKRFGQMDKRIDKVENYIDEIRKDISFLKGTIEVTLRSSGALTQAHSPISLTEKGERVAEEIEADKIIATNWERMRATLDAEDLKTAYDIQQFCIETPEFEPLRFFDETTVNHIKDFAFNQGMPIQMYYRMLGVIIRDRYFDEKGIPLQDVDKEQ